MLKTVFIVLLPLLILFSSGTDHSLTKTSQNGQAINSGTLEKMIVANGSVAMNIDLNRLNGIRSDAKAPKTSELRFDVVPDSFFTVVAFNDELRGPLPSSMELIPQNSAILPAKLNASYQQLVIESMPWGEPYELVVRDGKTGFVFFNIEGHQFEYDSTQHSFNIQAGRLLLSREFAAEIGQSSKVGAIVGQISVTSTTRPIEVTQIVDGEAKADVMPANPQAGAVLGPDVVVGDLSGLAQFGSSNGTQVGLSVGTDSCNFGTVDLHWDALPSNDHPVIPQNMYRMSGGPTNDDRFEQIGQSSVKHAFTALTGNICNLGCNGVGGTRLGSGCSDPYSASLNSGPSLGSRAWINPFSGAYPRGDSVTPPNNHAGHNHNGPVHRILTDISDLNTTLNQGATYYAEAQYITPHEYNWCQSNPGQCNMNNNVSYRKYNVIGTGSPFSFTPAAATVRAQPALAAWTGAKMIEIKPDPANDGVAIVAYKVTPTTSRGIWHYEYAIYNQNLDRAIQSFGLRTGAGIVLSNVGFHAPPQQPGTTFDGTTANTGFSNAAWTQRQSVSSVTWNSESFSRNQNSNAIRWGTLYNFRFDSNRPPQTVNATIGFLKTGEPMTIQVLGPSNPSTVIGVSEPQDQKSNNEFLSMMDSGDSLSAILANPLGYYSFN